jgi:hypothetical protein
MNYKTPPSSPARTVITTPPNVTKAPRKRRNNKPKREYTVRLFGDDLYSNGNGMKKNTLNLLAAHRNVINRIDFPEPNAYSKNTGRLRSNIENQLWGIFGNELLKLTFTTSVPIRLLKKM